MRTTWIASVLLAAAMVAAGVQPCAGQAFSALPAAVPDGTGFAAAGPAAANPDGANPSAAIAEPQDSAAFAEGTRAINESRWADAIGIFARIADRKSEHAEGALYWKAYAENKLGKSGEAMSTCAELKAQFPKSSWREDCGALEIEIKAKSGQPVLPRNQQSDDLRLLALNSMMQRDPAHAQAQIQEILDDEDSSDRLREGALFVLGKHESSLTFPQIVRLSYLEGDVRVARGRQAEKSTGAEWEDAVANLPLDTGFSLATGAGKAEIELEDASTIYLGENSVLTFNDLHTSDGVPYTDIGLISGTATLHVRPFVAGEMFVLRTPSDADLITTYPNTSYMRVTAYVDATAVTEFAAGKLRLTGAVTQPTQPGQTLYFSGTHRLEAPAAAETLSFADWDKWVAGRVEKRAAETSEVMAQAGVTSPLPGMAEMAGQGQFFDCAPYGKCWEPNAAVAADEAKPEGGAATAAGQSAGPLPAAAAEAPPGGVASAAARPQHGPIGFIAGPSAAHQAPMLTGGFPCMPTAVMMHLQRDPASARTRWVGDSVDVMPYQWAVCHAGYWVPHHKRYVWCVGKRHHHEPVRWMRVGGRIAFVPIHPRDVKGNIPLNAKDLVFTVNKNGPPEAVRLQPDQRIEALNDPPREFRTARPIPLARAEAPKLVGRELKGAAATKTVAMRTVPITFDHRTQSFMMARQEMHGSRSVTVSAPVGGRSSGLQAHAGNPGGGSHGGSAGASGGSHGGGSSGGGGGSHGGGSSAASASSGGGGHH